MKASKPKEVVQVKIKNKHTQCAVSNSGNASLVLNSLASNENSDSSGSNKSENTAAQSNISVLNKGKRKATEIEEGSELQIPVSHDDFDALDSLFKNPLSTPVPSLSPSEFRRLVYIYGSKAVSFKEKAAVGQKTAARNCKNAILQLIVYEYCTKLSQTLTVGSSIGRAFIRQVSDMGTGYW
ncbi:hypothetical protein G6F57_002113 [Rhizopus arrhizus]|uniref:BEN domain-containing protein n=1 Tax=Rhizopus oryzae TaxID=64495 RepID=A0A9P6XGG4_RHIOR|nr:hypothetical protein G6F23_004630 [Rhizopus arrhizus]KAG1425206.1 hypothetical protein G6F58_002039 [Rhizopus delemar]KAG0767931.1 hypothetical protein G6F24_002374 [Rhizopus arrhizus]KAG0778086.1 hypothetical protein G6F22_011445 [Rhizopus arrhizus]KAG0795188.1 hypothetical protein G6F21_002299 [Rhizopus arrhizus]